MRSVGRWRNLEGRILGKKSDVDGSLADDGIQPLRRKATYLAGSACHSDVPTLCLARPRILRAEWPSLEERVHKSS
jgi:hypothetical protein